MRNIAAILVALLLAASCADEDLTWEDPIIKHAPCDPGVEVCLATPLEDTPVEDMGWRPGSDDTSTTTSIQPRGGTMQEDRWTIPPNFGLIGECAEIKRAELDRREREGLTWVSAYDHTDDDGDGLLRGDEFFMGTDPANPDTDGDGFSDGVECGRLDSDPLDAGDPHPVTTAVPWISCGAAKQAWLAENESMAWVTPKTLTDDDGDGIQYSDERYYGTDPDNPDTDGDGFSDGEECRNNTNPLDAADPDR